jgi:hypothetical protein
MFILSVAASCPRQEPAIFIKQLKDITDLHGQTLLSVFGTVKLSPDLTYKVFEAIAAQAIAVAA